MEVTVKKQIFVMLLISAFLSSVNLQAMDGYNSDGDALPQRRLHGFGAHGSSAALRSAIERPANLSSARHNMMAHFADTGVRYEPQAAGRMERFMASPWNPWNYGSVLSSKIKSYRDKAEPVRDILIRCFIEAGMCYLFLYLFTNNILDAAGDRMILADWARKDLVSLAPPELLHFKGSKFSTAISGLECFATSVMLYGLLLGKLGVGAAVGLRCAYDALTKLPPSVLKAILGRTAGAEARRRIDLSGWHSELAHRPDWL
jgi:hypothetical protein